MLEILNFKIMLRLLLIVPVLCACSSPPRNTGEIFDQRRRAEIQLDLGNRHADRGSFDTALIFLNEALRLALSSDDPSLRIRAELSRSNVLFSTGHREEAAAGWNEALAEAERLGNRELIALCRIYIARGRLISSGSGVAGAVRDEVNRELGMIRSDHYAIAFAWTVIALAEKERGRFSDAESAMRRSLAIHERERNFELAAYNWFLIASFRSQAGNYSAAITALEMAIDFDRRVENSWGLANDWRAMGDVYIRAGNRAAAHAAYHRSAGIFRAMGLDGAAQEVLSRIEQD